MADTLRKADSLRRADTMRSTSSDRRWGPKYKPNMKKVKKSRSGSRRRTSSKRL